MGPGPLPAHHITSQLNSGPGAVKWAQARGSVLPVTSCTVFVNSLHLTEAQFSYKSEENKSCLTRQLAVVRVFKKGNPYETVDTVAGSELGRIQGEAEKDEALASLAGTDSYRSPGSGPF